jgi:hypothetical protein
MIRIDFNEPQNVNYDGINCDALFCLCEKYIALLSGDLIAQTNKETNALVYCNNIKSVKEIKPTDL